MQGIIEPSPVPAADGLSYSPPYPLERPRLPGRHFIEHLKYEYAKRLLDLVGASVLLLILLPVLLTVSAAIAAGGRPVLFRHQRIGRHATRFYCLKFRSMVPNADEVLRNYLQAVPEAREEWERDFKLRNDPRITRVGRFLRKTSLDEIPQLLNVLAGDMSLVGPRPIIESEIARYGADIDHYYHCRPGITGLWQVSGRNDTSYAQRVRLDVDYARRYSICRDIAILGQTIRVVLSGSGAY